MKEKISWAPRSVGRFKSPRSVGVIYEHLGEVNTISFENLHIHLFHILLEVNVAPHPHVLLFIVID